LDEGCHRPVAAPLLSAVLAVGPSTPVWRGNLHRLLARRLPRCQTATPDKPWRHFLDAGDAPHITDEQVTCALNLRSYHPVLIDAGFGDLQIPIPLVARPRAPRPLATPL